MELIEEIKRIKNDIEILIHLSIFSLSILLGILFGILYLLSKRC